MYGAHSLATAVERGMESSKLTIHYAPIRYFILYFHFRNTPVNICRNMTYTPSISPSNFMSGPANLRSALGISAEVPLRHFAC
jgi:hypothetical protein